MLNTITRTAVEGGILSHEDFQTHWPSIQKELDRNPGIWADYFTKQSIYDAVLKNTIQVWGFSEDGKIRMIVFTKLTEYPRGTVLHIMMILGNSLDRLLPQMEATLENFAHATGCIMCEIIGREGWVRKLSHRFKKRAVVMTAFPLPRDRMN